MVNKFNEGSGTCPYSCHPQIPLAFCSISFSTTVGPDKSFWYRSRMIQVMLYFLFTCCCEYGKKKKKDCGVKYAILIHCLGMEIHFKKE